MNCRDARVEFVTTTGHPELVKTVDGDTCVDNGANRWLNKGLRWLSTYAMPPMNHVRIQASLTQGAYTFDVPQCQSLMRLWLIDPESGHEVPLEKLSPEDMRARFRKTPGVLHQHKPRYFCRNYAMADNALPRNAQGTWWQYSGVKTSGDFPKPIFVPWGTGTFTTPWVMNDNGMVFYAGSGYNSNTDWVPSAVGLVFDVLDAVPMQVLLNATFPASVSNLTYIVATIQTEGNGIAELLETASGVVSVSGDDSLQTLSLAPGRYILFFCVNTDIDGMASGESVTLNKFSVSKQDNSATTDNFMILPPADKPYSLEGIGQVYADEFIADGDTTWWSHEHPELVVPAAMEEYERWQMRNASGADELARPLIEKLTIIRHKLAEDEISGPSEQSYVGCYERKRHHQRNVVWDDDAMAGE